MEEVSQLSIQVNNLDTNVSFQIGKIVQERGVSYLEAALSYWSEFADEDDIEKFALQLDPNIKKEIEHEALHDGKISSASTVDIDNFISIV